MKKLLVTTAIILALGAASGAYSADTIKLGNQSGAAGDQMGQKFNDIFNSFFATVNNANPQLTGDKKFIPFHDAGFSTFARTDMYETPDSIEISVEAPGIKKEDIDLQTSGNSITIKYEQKKGAETKDKNYSLKERSYGNFVRQFSLPDNANVDAIRAEYKDGVLYVSVPKVKDRKAVISKKIDIK